MGIIQFGAARQNDHTNTQPKNEKFLFDMSAAFEICNLHSDFVSLACHATLCNISNAV